MNNSGPRYVLGLADMDTQHEYLYSLFDRIEEKTTVTDAAALKPLLVEIERYVLFHFASEEHLMRAYNAPSFSVHQTDHEQAGAKLVQFLDDFDAGRLNPAALRIWLTGWLMEHSKLSDSEYARWVKAERAKLRR
jgi:hemerythrin